MHFLSWLEENIYSLFEFTKIKQVRKLSFVISLKGNMIII